MKYKRILIGDTNCTPHQKEVWHEFGLVGHMTDSKKPMAFWEIYRDYLRYCADWWLENDSAGEYENLSHEWVAWALLMLIENGFVEVVKE